MSPETMEASQVAYSARVEELKAQGMEGERMMLPAMQRGDYFKGGILHSSNGEPKEHAYETDDGRMVVFPIVDPADLPSRSLTPEQINAIRESVRDRCFGGYVDYRDKTFDGFFDEGTDRDAFDKCLYYRDAFSEMAATGAGLMLYGELGTGKTHLAACLCNALIDKGRKPLMTNVTRLVDRGIARHGDLDGLLNELSEYDLIVLDDFGSERNGENMPARVFQVVDFLASNRIPVIVTTNMTAEQIHHPHESVKKILARLWKCTPVEVKGKNRRQMRVM